MRRNDHNQHKVAIALRAMQPDCVLSHRDSISIVNSDIDWRDSSANSPAISKPLQLASFSACFVSARMTATLPR